MLTVYMAKCSAEMNHCCADSYLWMELIYRVDDDGEIYTVDPDRVVAAVVAPVAEMFCLIYPSCSWSSWLAQLLLLPSYLLGAAV